MEHKHLLVSNIADFRVRVLSTLKLIKRLIFKILRSTQTHNEALYPGDIESNLEPDRAWASPSPEGRDLERG